jgi:hypothetical protein
MQICDTEDSTTNEGEIISIHDDIDETVKFCFCF